ncbi:MAG: hypothetical protein EOO23_04975 [Comamonadaceae bacterium]|nr:MAG: hypothetical protein EOO23_04975 [Comamonadaceae bacterium]
MQFATINYKIRLADGTTQIVKIFATTFKKLKVWKLDFELNAHVPGNDCRSACAKAGAQRETQHEHGE